MHSAKCRYGEQLRPGSLKNLLVFRNLDLMDVVAYFSGSYDISSIFFVTHCFIPDLLFCLDYPSERTLPEAGEW